MTLKKCLVNLSTWGLNIMIPKIFKKKIELL